MKARTILLHVVTDPTYYSSLKYSPIFGFENFSDLDLIQTDTAEQLVIGSHKYLEKVEQGLDSETIKTVVKEESAVKLLCGLF